MAGKTWYRMTCKGYVVLTQRFCLWVKCQLMVFDSLNIMKVYNRFNRKKMLNVRV
jgi:hypothetical protein